MYSNNARKLCHILQTLIGVLLVSAIFFTGKYWYLLGVFPMIASIVYLCKTYIIPVQTDTSEVKNKGERNTLFTAELKAKYDAALATIPNIPVENPYAMRQFRHALNLLKSGETHWSDGSPIKASLVIIGDSITDQRKFYTDKLARDLVENFGDGGIGWCGFGSKNNAVSARNNVRIDTFSYQVLPSEVNWVFTGTGEDSVDVGALKAKEIGAEIIMTISDRFFSDANGSYISGGVYLHTDGNTGGKIEYSWDNGHSWVESDLEGEDTKILSMNSNLPAPVPISKYTLKIRVIEGEPKFYGIDVRSKNPGVVLHKCAAKAESMKSWSNSDFKIMAQGYKSFDPAAFMIMMGTNDQLDSTPEEFGLNMANLVHNIRSQVSELVDIIIIAPNENNKRRVTSMVSLSEKARLVAKSCDATFLDLQQVFGQVEHYKHTDEKSTRNWLQKAGLHPSPSTILGGGSVYAFTLYSFLTGDLVRQDMSRKRVHVSNNFITNKTLKSPGLREIQEWNNALKRNKFRNTVLYFTGTNDPNDDPVLTYHVDLEGAVTPMYDKGETLNMLTDIQSKINTILTDDGRIIFSRLPDTDPHVAGQLWSDQGTLKASLG